MAEPSEQTPPVDAVDAGAAPVAEKPIAETPAAEDPTAEKPVDEEPSAPVSESASVAAEETDDDILSKKVTLADLSAKGSALYAQRNYEEATEIFSKASILQAEINGETAPENAEILFHYGRSLFKVGQSKSDVLGGPAAAEKRKTKPNASDVKSKKPAPIAEEPAETEADKVTQEGVVIVAEKKEGEKSDVGANKPLFQFTGDENFDESDEDEEGGDDEGEEEEEEDDLATAFEILDLARVCYLKRLEQLQAEEQASSKGKEVSNGSDVDDSPSVRHVKERLADTHDCLAEISLENERYPAAIEDGRISLGYKLGLYPEESEIIAEAHYKLSLALEFASVTSPGEDGANNKREEMDQGLRDEAVKEMELAIKSSKLKLQNEEVELATMASPEDNELARKSIQEMKEVISDMEQRLVDLKNDPIDAKDILGGEVSGIFGAAMGESAAETQARVEEAKKNATDLTNLVRKKKAPEEPKKPEEGPTKTEEETKKPEEETEKPEEETEKPETLLVETESNKRKTEEPEDEQPAKKVKLDNA